MKQRAPETLLEKVKNRLASIFNFEIALSIGHLTRHRFAEVMEDASDNKSIIQAAIFAFFLLRCSC